MPDTDNHKPETLEEKISRVIAERVDIVPYDPQWPILFEAEKTHLLQCLPKGIITRIEHYGSTSVPGLAAKPIVDMLVEVHSLEETKTRIAPELEKQAYDYFWRPSFGDDTPPWYAWFIKRGPEGRRTHHIHMVEAHFPQWNALYFRDYLRKHPQAALEYQTLKLELAKDFGDDRVKYTRNKGDFIMKITAQAMNEATL